MKARWFLEDHLTSHLCPAALLCYCVNVFFVGGLLHASGIKLASCHWYSDHTGREGEEQSVAHPV